MKEFDRMQEGHMSETDMNNDYEKPETHQLSGDELEDVAGGTPKIPGVCGAGQDAPSGCTQGQTPRSTGQSCQEGKIPQGECTQGDIATK
jgi:hypothetical protein